MRRFPALVLPGIALRRTNDRRNRRPLQRGPLSGERLTMSTTTRSALTTGVATTLTCAVLALVPGRAQERIDELYGQLPGRFIGPEGNRVIAVAGVPSDPLVYYVGAASGGIWKTSDGGQDWGPVFDHHAVCA